MDSATDDTSEERVYESVDVVVHYMDGDGRQHMIAHGVTEATGALNAAILHKLTDIILELWDVRLLKIEVNKRLVDVKRTAPEF